jgi:putative DNA primase/helicase
LKHIIGTENISLVSLQDLANYQFAAARLFGKLLNLYDDLPTTFIKQTGMLKMLSGESPVGAQRKFKDPIEFDNYAKLMFVTNKLPSLKEMADEAFFSRWIITEYTNSFKRNDRFFSELIADEREIEALIIAAFYSLASLLNVGYEFMQGTKNYTELWKCQTNNIYDFMINFERSGKIKYGPELYVLKDSLYSLYTSFTADERDDTPEKKTSFTQELERLFHIGASRMKVEGQMQQVYKGVAIVMKDQNEPQEKLDYDEVVPE